MRLRPNQHQASFRAGVMQTRRLLLFNDQIRHRSHSIPSSDKHNMTPLPPFSSTSNRRVPCRRANGSLVVLAVSVSGGRSDPHRMQEPSGSGILAPGSKNEGIGCSGPLSPSYLVVFYAQLVAHKTGSRLCATQQLYCRSRGLASLLGEANPTIREHISGTCCWV